MDHLDHGPYIDAVVAALAADDIPVRTRHLNGTHVDEHLEHEVRGAVLELDHTAIDDLAYTDLDQLLLAWDETRGWALRLVYQPGVGLAPPPVWRGTDAVGEPTVVAAWAGLALTHPEVVASREEPVRRAGDADELEHALARWHTTPTQ